MNPLRWLRRISSRTHLAVGLAALAVGVVLAAGYAGIVPDGEAGNPLCQALARPC